MIATALALARGNVTLRTRHTWNHHPRPSSSRPQGLLQSAAPIERALAVVFFNKVEAEAI